MSDLDSGREAGGVALPAAADLARELRVLVRLRSPASVKQAELPALRSRCGDDLAGCVDRAIAGIAETKYRAAAESLLGSGDGRWSTLERRGQLAAEAFGLSTYDAYRKPRRSTTTSHMEETLDFFLPFNGTLRWQPVADPAAALPPEPVGHILRHDDGTTWYVDQKRQRHWIPDGDTYDCLSRKGATQIDGVPGYATATLSLGAPATCR